MLFHERWYPLLRDTSLGFLPTPPRPCRGQASWMLPEMSPVWSQKMYLKISKSGYQNLRAFRATAAFRVDQRFRSWNSTILEYILDQAAKNWLNRWIPGLKNIFSGWDPVTSGTHEGKRACIQIKEHGSASNKDPTHQWDNETPTHKRIYYWN